MGWITCFGISAVFTDSFVYVRISVGSCFVCLDDMASGRIASARAETSECEFDKQ